MTIADVYLSIVSTLIDSGRFVQTQFPNEMYKYVNVVNVGKRK